MNLDPFNRHTDLEIYDALEHSYLLEFVQGTIEKLEYECGEDGEALRYVFYFNSYHLTNVFSLSEETLFRW